MKVSARKPFFNFCALLCLQAAGLAWAQSASTEGAPRIEGQFAVGAISGPLSYSVTDIDVVPSGMGLGLNDKGQVVGGYGNQTVHPFLWQEGKTTDLGTLGGANAWATGINNEGQVVGTSEAVIGSGIITHAFLWQNGRITDLGTLGGTSSRAGAINDKGQVVGSSITADGSEHVFLWQNGQMSDLGSLGGDSSEATGINNEGQVVGGSITPEGRQDAFIWQHGQVTDIGGGPGLGTSATGINNQGQVSGSSASLAKMQNSYAFVWQDGQTTNLGYGFGLGINDKGQVIGYASDSLVARLWQDGKVYALDTLIPPASGWELAIAIAINDAGQIVGLGAHNGRQSIFLLTPVHTVDATLQLSLPSWQFAAHPIGDTSGPGIIWVYNAGTQAATFNSVQFAGADPKDFAIAENTCGSTLAPFTSHRLLWANAMPRSL
jgi:probable HAF family extracellular repeat protein